MSVYAENYSVADDLQVTPLAPAPGRISIAFLVGCFVWSVGSAFSHFYGEETAHWIAGGVLALAIVIIGLPHLQLLVAWVQSVLGLLIAAHAAAALLSGIVNGGHPLAAVRYLLLIPAISIMITAVRLGDRGVAGTRLGITLGGIAFCIYQFSFLDFGSLLNPRYRLFLFLNPNGVGFIAAMTGISLLDYALTRFFVHRKRVGPRTIALFGGVGMCLLLCVATKSRTATLVMLTGSLLRVYLSLGATRSLLLGAVVALLSVTVAWDAVAAAGDQVAEVFQLNDQHRSIDKGTGRFRIWSWVIREVWLEHPFLGVGPQGHMMLTSDRTGISSAHNGLIGVLADTGIVGALPLLIILGICTRRAFLQRRNPRYFFAITLFAGGLLESVAELMFFSIGNPGSLLFLLSVGLLSVQSPMENEAAIDPAYLAEDTSAQWPDVA